MKRIFNIGLPVFSAAFMIAGCTGIDRNTLTMETGDAIRGIRIADAHNSTRCSSEYAEEVIFSKPIITDSGDTLYLNLTLSDMPDWDAAQEDKLTRGAPVTTDNISTLYDRIVTSAYDSEGNVFNSVVDPDAEPQSTVPMQNVTATFDSGEGKWKFGDTYYWPLDPDSLLTFCSYAPAQSFGESAGATVPVWNGTSYGFSYTMPKDPEGKNDATFQKDLLLAVDTQKKKDGVNVNVNFKHLLTAVRFTKGNIENVVLEYIQLNNFCNKGNVTLTDGAVAWSDVTGCDTYRQTFNTQLNGMEDHASFDTTANKVYTFMVIPQALSDSSEIAIYIKGNLHPEVLKLKDFVEEKGLKDKDGNPISDWRPYAGKMLTFDISATNINNVSVSIDDEVVPGVNNYPLKQNVVITNTGRSDIYIRATIVGNWQNQAGQNIQPWSEDIPYGTFTGGLLGGGENYWTKGDDGFYYYKYYISKPKNDVMCTVKHPLFTTFQLTSAPESRDEEGTDASGQDLVVKQLDLTIMVQAVAADQDRSMASAKAAWGNNVVNYLTDEEDK